MSCCVLRLNMRWPSVNRHAHARGGVVHGKAYGMRRGRAMCLHAVLVRRRAKPCNNVAVMWSARPCTTIHVTMGSTYH